jgi:hypothetical protein
VADEKWSARFRTHDQIRSHGAIGNLNDGIEIMTQGVRTRLIAWPGNGFQTESVHVLTLAPGEESALYDYDMSDEAMLCFKGQGEVYMRGRMGADRARRYCLLPGTRSSCAPQS